MEEKILSEKESLELISKMIQNSQRKFRGNSGSPFLIYGYTSVIVSLTIYFLHMISTSELIGLAWLGIPVIGFALSYLTKKKDEQHGKTIISNMISKVWTVITVAIFGVSFTPFLVPIPVLPIIILLLGIGTTITGLIVKSNSVTVGGILGMISTIAVFTFQYYGYNQIAVFAICIFIMQVIPGHILQYKSNTKNV
jgi:hypothetical protein